VDLLRIKGNIRGNPGETLTNPMLLSKFEFIVLIMEQAESLEKNIKGRIPWSSSVQKSCAMDFCGNFPGLTRTDPRSGMLSSEF